MTEPNPESAAGSRDVHKINCPYCPESFEISLRTADGKLLALEDAEIEALPYARDIDVFDPDPREEGRNNSSFTKIGTDFFGGLNYERIGILHMEPDWDVRYCVARCTKCRMLIDVFVNLTRDQRLGDIWPHLLRRSPDKDHHIILWRPTDIIDRIFGQPVLVFVFLLLLFGGSLAPQLMSSTVQTPSEADRLAEQLVPALITRFIVLVTAFALVCLRSGIIDVFADEKWSDLFLVKRELIAYWSNFAVCRFAGYQKNGNFATPNAVMVLGGLSSLVVFLLVWTIVNFSNVSSFSDHDVLPFITLTAFWCVISYILGVLVWSLSVVSVYVFRGLKNIPMQVDSGYTIREFKLIERARLYATSGVAVLTADAIALSMLPIFVAPFAELTAALIWAQSALIVCFSILVIRFGIWHEQDVFKKSAGMVKLGGMIALFLGVRTGIGLPEARGFLIHWMERLTDVPAADNRKYAEVVVFSLIAAYLFYRLAKDVIGREIKEGALKNAWRQYNDDRNKAIYAGDLDKAAEMRKLSPLSLEGEKPANRRLQFVAAFFSAVGAIVPLIELALKHLSTGK